MSWDAWDATAYAFALMSRPDFAGVLASARSEADHDELLRMRLRWRIDEFAEVCVRPHIEATPEGWAPSNELHRVLYAEPPIRAGRRSYTVRHLLLSARGVGKSSCAKIRAFHGAVYGISSVTLAVGKTDRDGVGWVDAIRRWAADPCPETRRLWPRLGASGNQHEIEVVNAGHAMTLLAAGWTGSIRGLNVALVRPDRVFLDDIDSEEECRTLESRDKAQDRLNQKILPLEPIAGGAEFWWLNTPPHHDSISSRAARGMEGMQSWQVHRFPAVRRWPDSPLWERVRSAYLDLDSARTVKERLRRAWDVYTEHRDELDRGADVLDPHRFGIFKAFLKRWDIGERAWATEYQVDPRATGGRVYDSTTFCYHRLDGQDVVTQGGKRVPIRDLRRIAVWDPSDGGDPGGLCVGGGESNGRTFALSLRELPVDASTQVREVVREAMRFDVASIYFEANQLGRLVRKALDDAAAELGFRGAIVPYTTHEAKEPRLASLEPAVRNGEFSFPHDLAPAVRAHFDDFDPASRRNRDDCLDAAQRCHERLHGPRAEWGQRHIGW